MPRDFDFFFFFTKPILGQLNKILWAAQKGIPHVNTFTHS